MQTQAMLDVIAVILRKAGLHLDHVLTTTISLAGLDGFSGMNASYAAAFKPPSSARSIIEISRCPSSLFPAINSIALLNGKFHDDH